MKARRWWLGGLIAVALICGGVLLYDDVSKTSALKDARRRAKSIGLEFEPELAMKRLPASEPASLDAVDAASEFLKQWSDGLLNIEEASERRKAVELAEKIADQPTSAYIGDAEEALTVGSEESAVISGLGQCVVTVGLLYASEGEHDQALESARLADRLREKHLGYPAPQAAVRCASLYEYVSYLLVKLIEQGQNSPELLRRIRQFQSSRAEMLPLQEYVNSLTAAGVLAIRQSGKPRSTVNTENIWPAAYPRGSYWAVAPPVPSKVAQILAAIRSRIGIKEEIGSRIQVRVAETRLLNLGSSFRSELTAAGKGQMDALGTAFVNSSATALESIYTDQLENYLVSRDKAVGGGQLILCAVDVFEARGKGQAAMRKDGEHWTDPLTGKVFFVTKVEDGFILSSQPNPSPIESPKGTLLYDPLSGAPGYTIYFRFR